MLECSCYFHVQFSKVIGTLKHFSGRKLSGLYDFRNLIVTQANNHIFRLKVSMNNFALTMDVVETDQALTSKLSNQRNGNATVVVTFDDFQKVNT